MENETNKPLTGTWEKMTTEDVEKRPKINFEVNITQRVVFVSDTPKEFPSVDGLGVFYVFDVEQNKEERAIVTSAWTLLQELKKLSPLIGKVADITKKLAKGKQFFEVKLVE